MSREDSHLSSQMKSIFYFCPHVRSDGAPMHRSNTVRQYGCGTTESCILVRRVLIVRRLGSNCRKRSPPCLPLAKLLPPQGVFELCVLGFIIVCELLGLGASGTSPGLSLALPIRGIPCSMVHVRQWYCTATGIEFDYGCERAQVSCVFELEAHTLEPQALADPLRDTPLSARPPPARPSHQFHLDNSTFHAMWAGESKGCRPSRVKIEQNYQIGGCR